MYRGQVSAVDGAGVYVLVPALHPTAPFGPLEHVGATPAVGARVLVVDCGGESEPDLVVLTGGFPATSTDNAVARFNGTAGALQNSGVTIDDSGRISSSGTSGTSNYLFVATTNNSAILWSRASGASGNYAYQIMQTRTGQADENETQTGLSYDGSLYLQQKKVGGSSVNRDIWNIRPDGKFRFTFVGATGGLEMGSSGPRIMSGSGTPESVVTAPVGSLWLRTNGGAGTTLYVKESGSGNTGWRAV